MYLSQRRLPLLAVLLFLSVWCYAQSVRTKTLTKNDLTMSSTESNKMIVKQLYQECLNSRHLDSLASFISEDYVAINGQKGAAGFQSTIDALIKAFNDAQWNIEEVLGDGDKVYIRWNFKGTQSGQFQHIAATGKKVSNTGMAVYTLRGGKVTATLVFTDRLSFLQQLGVLPAEL